jgi:hypothetical protein
MASLKRAVGAINQVGAVARLARNGIDHAIGHVLGRDGFESACRQSLEHLWMGDATAHIGIDHARGQLGDTDVGAFELQAKAFGKGRHRVFGGGIHHGMHAHIAGRTRGDENQLTAPALDHVLGHFARNVVTSDHIGGEHFFALFNRHVQNRRVIQNARVIDKHIDIVRRLGQLAHKGFVVQVAWQRQHLHALIATGLGHGLQLGHLAPCQHQMHATAGQ